MTHEHKAKAPLGALSINWGGEGLKLGFHLHLGKSAPRVR
jgi:hypothetical protein